MKERNVCPWSSMVIGLVWLLGIGLVWLLGIGLVLLLGIGLVLFLGIGLVCLLIIGLIWLLGLVKGSQDGMVVKRLPLTSEVRVSNPSRLM